MIELSDNWDGKKGRGWIKRGNDIYTERQTFNLIKIYIKNNKHLR